MYVPDQPGKLKNDFWSKILEYSLKNQKKNILISGDFNSCTSEDSSNQIQYNFHDLIKLGELGYTWTYGKINQLMGPNDLPGFTIMELALEWIMFLFPQVNIQN